MTPGRPVLSHHPGASPRSRERTRTERGRGDTLPRPRAKRFNRLGSAGTFCPFARTACPLPRAPEHAPQTQAEGLCRTQRCTPHVPPAGYAPGASLALSSMRTGPSHGLTDRQGEGAPGTSAGQMRRFVFARQHSRRIFLVRPNHPTTQPETLLCACQVSYAFFKEGTALKCEDS